VTGLRDAGDDVVTDHLGQQLTGERRAVGADLLGGLRVGQRRGHACLQVRGRDPRATDRGGRTGAGGTGGQQRDRSHGHGSQNARAQTVCHGGQG